LVVDDDERIAEGDEAVATATSVRIASASCAPVQRL
jgi:hypothetical protein